MSEATVVNGELKYKGRISQTWTYLKKFLRMFVYQSDWKVLPIGALIAALVTFVVGSELFVNQEGTNFGTFALTCVCIWNGFFNSIQVVCRERNIVKREHRAGMHISSYIAAHMLYQLILCLLQTLVTMLILVISGVKFPAAGIIVPAGIIDTGITILLITYAADVMALMVSCIVKTTTTAMTVMPFLLIFQLVFSGGFFELGSADFIKVFTISHWGMDSMCTIGRYNDLPMKSLWNTMIKFQDITIPDTGEQPVKTIVQYIEQNNLVDDFKLWSGSYNTNQAYVSIASNVWTCWLLLLLFIVVFAVASVIALKFIDRDKR